MMNSRRRAKERPPDPPALDYRDCPAKTYEDNQGQRRLGRNVFEHCQIVGEVARALINKFPPALQPALFPKGSALLAAVHDIGKVSPTFFLKLQTAVSGNDSPWLQTLAQFKGISESEWGGHAGVSALALENICLDPFVAKVAGQHHGATPSTGMLLANSPVLGGAKWQEQRYQLVLALQKAFNQELPQIQDHEQSRLLAGLTTVADWIGSGSFFEDPSQPWQTNIEPALELAGFIAPSIRRGLTFGDIFQDHLGTPYQPNAIQIALHQSCQGCGVYVLEAPMGLGKTEAALYAAYHILERGEASGVYFALPTQLTSNKIYDRFNHYLQAILAEDSPHRHALLLHGNAWLVQHELGEEGRPGYGWFQSSKRGLLAPFAVGTLDQALMAAMNVKHGFVRAFGLAGKVVILDEVHSYDAYTSVILDKLIALLRQLHCTVIILSATLNKLRCAELIGQPTYADAYPLITSSSGVSAGALIEQALPIDGRHDVSIEISKIRHRLSEEILRRAAEGEHILWVENTVSEAQERYAELAARTEELGIACGLLHSRFTAAHRQSNEDLWVGRYGKTGWAKRTEQGCILIGTQVLEQSLDIDADLLVTRFAPTDMLLQRLGRLWRHKGTPRPAGARRQAWILAPELTMAEHNPLKEFGATASVYSPYILCRSLEVWQKQAVQGSVRLPDDIRPLVEATYQERKESGALAQWQHELFEGNRYRKGLNSLKQLARVTLAKGGKTLPESKAQTRYSEQDSAQLLLLKKLSCDDSEKLTYLHFLDGTSLAIPWQKHCLSKIEWRQKAAQVGQHMVNCRQSQRPRSPARSWCQKIGLGNVLYLGSPEWDDAGVGLAIVTPTNELKAADGSALPLSERFTYYYRDDIGLKINKIKE